MIRQWGREIVACIVRILGLHLIFIKRISRNKATIVVYHDPPPEVLDKHLEYLSKHFNLITLDRLVQAIRDGDWSNVPKGALVITLDDGHKGNYKLIKIFKKYKVRPTIYLCSHIVNSNRHFWWKAGHSNFHRLKKLPNEERLAILRNAANFEPEREYDNRQALNKSELLKMQPFVDYGSHTKFHPILPSCPDEVSRDEIEGSKIHLEGMLGQPIEHFCYPNGDYGTREMDYLKACGYKSARTLTWGWNDKHSDPFQLKVIEFLDDSSINMLCAHFTGVFVVFRTLRVAVKRLLKLQ